MNIIFIFVMKFHVLLILIYDYFYFFFNIIFKYIKYYYWRKMDIEEVENDKSIEKPSVFLKF